MRKRNLGGLVTAEIGLGCMGFSQSYGPADDEQSVATVRRAVERGTTLFDSSDMYGYGNGHNEELLGRALRDVDEEVTIATKFGIRGWTPDRSFVLDSTPEYAREACETSLRRLGVEAIDLYYLHRRDRTLPIEEAIGGMAELVQAGKVRHIGLSEVNADTLRRAHATHPIAALESEYSLFEREVEQEILPTCEELGIGFVAFSPLGRGMLTGTIRDMSTVPDDDYRHTDPRFQAENLDHNLALVDRIGEVARQAGATSGQVALAWLLSRGDRVAAIPGTKRPERVDENAAAADLVLSPTQLTTLDEAVPRGAVSGDRYPEGIMRTVDA